MIRSDLQHQHLVSAGYEYDGLTFLLPKLATEKSDASKEASADTSTTSAVLLELNKSLRDLNERLAHIETLIKTPGSDREWYSVEEVARQLGKATFTVREWCRLHRITCYKRECGRGRHREWMISHKELERIRNKGLLPLNL